MTNINNRKQNTFVDVLSPALVLLTICVAVWPTTTTDAYVPSSFAMSQSQQQQQHHAEARHNAPLMLQQRKPNKRKQHRRKINDNRIYHAFGVSSKRSSSSLCMTDETSGDYVEIGFPEEEEEIAPNDMRVSEIKAELTLRGVKFSDCFDKESLATRLEEARATGKADPKILDDFNKKKLEENIKGEKPLENVRDEDIDAALGADGKLPGGMTPDKLKELLSNPELMILLQSPKMQDVMKLMMTEGPEKLTQKMQEDPEIKDLVVELNKIIGPTQQQ